MSVTIPLTQGKSTVVDDSCAFLRQWKWCVAYDTRTRGYRAKRSFRRIDGTYGQMYIHHAVVGFPLYKKVVDHINGNSLDNRRCNLRIVSFRENTGNKKRRIEGKSSSRYPGVYWQKYSKSWYVRADVKGKTHCIGHFKNEYYAGKAYRDFVKRAERGLVPYR